MPAADSWYHKISLSILVRCLGYSRGSRLSPGRTRCSNDTRRNRCSRRRGLVGQVDLLEYVARIVGAPVWRVTGRSDVTRAEFALDVVHLHAGLVAVVVVPGVTLALIALAAPVLALEA